MQFYQLLTDMHQSFSPEKAEETVAFIRHEINYDTLYREHDGLTVQMLINDQHEAFYHCLGRELLADLTADPNRYFRDWQPLLALFNRRSTNLLYAHSVQQACLTNTGHLLKGLWELELGQPAAAIYHFHQLAHAIRHYFIGRCYADRGAWHNAAKQYDRFLLHVDERWIQYAETIDSDELASEHIIMAQWQGDKERGLALCQLGQYTRALAHFDAAFNYFPADYLYELSVGRLGREANLFHTLVRSYLHTLEAAGHYAQALEVLAPTLKHFPTDPYYTAAQQRCHDATRQLPFAHQLLAQVLPPTPPSQATHTLEQLVVAQLEKGGPIFDRHLFLYEDENGCGRHCYIPGADAFVDLLLEDTHTLYPVIFPPPGAGAAAIHGLQRCMEALEEQYRRPVYGIVCLSEPDNEAEEAIGPNLPIDSYCYQLSFDQLI